MWGRRERLLADAVKGVVFYATPHFGSYLADIGWGLRHVGAKPHRVIQHLKPGPHHEELNTTLRYGSQPPRPLLRCLAPGRPPPAAAHCARALRAGSSLTPAS